MKKKSFLLFIAIGLMAAAAVGENVTDGLIGYWPMDEGTGPTIADMSINSNDGTINGAGWTSGIFDNGLNFDGGNDSVNCGTSSILRPTSGITVSAWVRPDAFGYYEGILSSVHDTGSTESGYDLHVKDDNRFYFGLSATDTGRITYLSSGTTYSAGSWYHVVGTYDGSTVKIYINGDLKNSTGRSGNIDYNPTPNTGFNIGRWLDNDGEVYYFDGKIDEVAVWDRALDQTEVTFLYNNSPISSSGGIPAVMITESLGSTEVDEDGGTDSYEIVLYSPPTDDVQITVTPADSQIDIGVGVGKARVLNFTAGGLEGTLRNDITSNLGLRFRVDREVSVNQLAFHDYGHDGLAASHTVRIYESNDGGASGTAIATVTIPAGTAAVLSEGFRWMDLASAVTLYPQTGSDWYVLAATVAGSGGDSWYRIGVTGFTFNSFMDTAAGWQACFTSDLGACPDSDTSTPDTTYYVFNMAESTPSTELFQPNSDGNWDIPQTIDVTADDDEFHEVVDPHTTVITHASQSVDSGYDGIPVNSVSVAVYDNEMICGDWGYLRSDIYKDCYVNILDLRELAAKWMLP